MNRLALFFVAAALVTAAPAAADGLPVLGIDVGASGVTVPGNPNRFIAITPGSTTWVERIARNGGQMLAIGHIHGTFTIPAVAYDGSASGLSHDGSKLVLIEPRLSFPRAQTRFAVVDTRTLSVIRVITLRGDYSFDAISPRGKTMFLIHYTSAGDPTRYTVRALDVGTGTLLRPPVTDPREPGDKMRGAPITRLMSTDGRFAYTLYDGAGGTPFVHALDTQTRTARCLDLPMLAGSRRLWAQRMTLTPDGRLHVGAAAVIDTSTYAISVPAAHTSSARWAWLLGVLAVALGLVAVAVRLRGRPVLRPSL